MSSFPYRHRAGSTDRSPLNPDAYVLLSYGGPREPDDVIPFLRNATGGRGIPEERLAEVGEHYYLFGGKSPINELNERLADNLRDELARRGDQTPVHIGNRNWTPYGNDVLQDLYNDGVRNVVALATSAYASYSSCRQYREDIARWLGEIDAPDMTIVKVRPFWDTPGFHEASLNVVKRALAHAEPGSRLVFVTHSIPTLMNDNSGRALELTYQAQHEKLATEIGKALDVDWDLVYCSRSGSPHTPWLEPDVNDHLEALAESGVTGVVLAPIGFISDHMEVLYDLDTEAKATAEKLGLNFYRADTVDEDPAFLTQLADLLQQPGTTTCSATCCWAKDEPTVAAH